MDLLQDLVNFRFHPLHLIIIFISLLLLVPSRAHGLKLKQMVAQRLECNSNILVYRSLVRPFQVGELVFRGNHEVFDVSEVLKLQ